ncbi:MAG: hypothetical protein IJE16_07485 [Ruminococcus sp.]|nr:hypothetical protein [Ruminococcus sp.]
MNKYLTLTTLAVDLAGGVQEVADQVLAQARVIFGIVFLLATLICLGFTVANAIIYASTLKKGNSCSPGTLIGCAIGTIVAGLATGTSFLGWFGI